jgi:hypothetical protein
MSSVAVRVAHETAIDVDVVKMPSCGSFILVGAVLIVAPTVLTLEYEFHPYPF